MPKIGFIDYYLNEWHADNYPQWIKERSGGEYTVEYAWAMSEPPHAGRMSNAKWAKNIGVTLCDTMEEVIEKSDAIVVLSPDNAELHEQLSQLPLKSGKPVFIDKTFTNDKATAQRIFDLAEQYHTPCFSNSALRYAAEYQEVDRTDINAINSVGGGEFEIYIIHQLEPIMLLMGCDIEKVMYIGSETVPSVTLQYRDGRFANLTIFKNGCDFAMTINHADRTKNIVIKSDFFMSFIDDLICFFKTNIPPVKREETVAIMAVREACLTARQKTHEWVYVK